MDQTLDAGIEHESRVYYQDIVYKVCNILDLYNGKKPGTGIVCGTVQEPSTEVIDALRAALKIKEAAAKAPNNKSAPFYIGCMRTECGWNTFKNHCGLVVCCPGRK